MRNKVLKNLIQSVVEKFLIIGTQFFLSFFLVRILEREDYGVIGIVSGYFVFVNFINISLESVMLRDHTKYEKNLEKYFLNFIIFNVFKSVLFILISLILSLYLTTQYSNPEFLYAVLSASFTLIADSIAAPFIIYSTSKFNQRLVTKITLIRSILNITLICGLLISPTLKYNAFKDLIVSSIYIFLWIKYSKKFIDYKRVFTKENIDFCFIRENLFDYSLWTHLNGVVTNFIYKSDTFFLSFFVSLQIIGDYNVALISANVANILPMILGYQNSVALSHAKDDKQAFNISNAFIRGALYIGFITLAGFFLLGKFYLKIITGQSNVDTIYTYMMFIVSSLVMVKTVASPLNSFINIRGSVKSLFKNVLVPTFLATVVLYYISSYLFGALGVAVANVLVASIWLMLIIKEVKKYNYDFKTIFDFKSDWLVLKELIQNGVRKRTKTY
jgi:O-antigen/teichoic acid export membrane protein